MTASSDADRLIKHRRTPKRSDSRQTMIAILDSAAELLQEFGIEDLSTNMICKHAGLTPPALYRYFPNKYAILFELAHRLLYWQHAALDAWIDNGGLSWTEERDGRRGFVELLEQLRAVADRQPGALWIIRGMRAIPRLREVRLTAHELMRDRLLNALRERYRGTPPELSVPSFLVSEMIHLGTELEFDYPIVEIEALRDNLALAMVTIIENGSATFPGTPFKRSQLMTST